MMGVLAAAAVLVSPAPVTVTTPGDPVAVGGEGVVHAVPVSVGTLLPWVEVAWHATDPYTSVRVGVRGDADRDPPRGFETRVPRGGVGLSAGLAYTLADELHGLDGCGGGLAATGVVSDAGEVLPVGGVAEKLEAARRAGVDVALVPAGQGGGAVGSLRVREVERVEEAVGQAARLCAQEG